jgi:hypothetical protein
VKLNVIQIILGAGIILAMAFSIAWDPVGFYVTQPLGTAGLWKTVFNPDVKEVIATIIAPVVLISGTVAIAVTITLLVSAAHCKGSASSLRQNNRERILRFTQIGLGGLIAVGAFLAVLWGFPTSYTFPDQQWEFMPGPQFVAAQLLSTLTFLLGVVYLVCSIAQLWAARSK